MNFRNALSIFCLCTITFAHAPLAIAQSEPEIPSSFAILLAAEKQTIAAIELAEKSVVAIARVPKRRAAINRASFNPSSPTRRFDSASNPLDDPNFVPQFYGSGLILSEDGFIVTCAHVLENPRENDYYVWSQNRAYRAELVGRQGKVYASDPFSDLAVLKVETKGLVPARFSKKPALRKGQFVLALGNPNAVAADGEASASWGIISNLTRMAPEERNPLSAEEARTLHQYGTLIQTDAKLGTGSSGGALVNLKGEVIGLTTSLSAGAGFERAAGYAIAIDPLFHRVTEALKKGRLPEYGFLGIQPDDLSPDEKQRLSGARVSMVFPGWPGDAAGLEEDDIITQVGPAPISGRKDLFRELSVVPPGKSVQLSVLRAGVFGQRTVQLTAKMSKKYVVSSPGGYAINEPAAWRGMTVEYTTALSPTRSRLGSIFDERQPSVSALKVAPGSAAWNAGVRPGNAIVAIENQAVATPDEFRNLAESLDGPVSLTLLHDGRTSLVKVLQN